jgi:hypothetical protein
MQWDASDTLYATFVPSCLKECTLPGTKNPTLNPMILQSLIFNLTNHNMNVPSRGFLRKSILFTSAWIARSDVIIFAFM